MDNDNRTDIQKILEEKFEEMKRQLNTAEKYIFLEYFIVERGKMWDEILEILIDKVKQLIEEDKKREKEKKLREKNAKRKKRK